MSVPATGGTPTAGAGEEAIELPRSGDAAFGALMDALAPEPDAGAPAAPAAAEGGQPAAPAAAGGADAGGAGDGQAGSAPAAADAAGAADGQPAAGGQPAADGAPAGGAEQPAATTGAGDRPADWTADSAAIIPRIGELSTKIEESTTQAYQAKALEEVRGEHGQYFAALEQHPRLLVGQQVPAIGKEGMETLRDTNDAREWQEAVKHILAGEVRDRASRAMDESKDYLQTVHASIELFQNNADLVPGTKNFDVELANRFAEMAKPYELRVDGKLHGYSIPVQPLVTQLRQELTSRRAASKQAPAAATGTDRPSAAADPPSGATPPAAPAQSSPAAEADAPQAGISSKAGNSGNAEDFSTLFGTIGLPNLQI